MHRGEAVSHVNNQTRVTVCKTGRLVHLKTHYQYNRLSFGYSLAPQTFSKCVETALRPLHTTGMRVLFYLDNLLLMARSKGEAAIQTKKLVIHLSNLGFAINRKKSSPLPSECDVFGGRAGFSCNESTALTAEDGDAVVSPPPLFPGQCCDSPLCHEAAGHDVSRSHGGAAGAASHEADAEMVFSPVHRPGAPIPVTIPLVGNVGPDLTNWGDPRTLMRGVPLGRATSHIWSSSLC